MMLRSTRTLFTAPKGGSVGVIGGGISGLSFAYFLTKLRPDLSITIFEAKNKTGGWIDTVRLHNKFNGTDIVFEKGPRTLRGVSDGTLVMLDMLKRMGHEDKIMIMKASSVANRKYLLDSNYQLVPVPHSLKSFMKFSTSEIFDRVLPGIIQEPFRKPLKNAQIDESIESFIQRRFGSTRLSDNILSGILHGIYAGDVSKLSVKSVLPRLKEFESTDGSMLKPMFKSLFSYLTSKKEREKRLARVFPDILNRYELELTKESLLMQLSKSLKGYPIVSLKDSLDFFPKVITEELKKNPKINILYNSHITEIDPLKRQVVCDDKTLKFDHIRSTISPKHLSSLITSTELKAEFDKINYVSVFMANIYNNTQKVIEKNEQGFGFLVPKGSKNKEFLLGTIFDSDISSHIHKLVDKDSLTDAKSFTNITMMLGGHFYDTNLPSDHLIIKAVKNCLAKVFHVDLDNTPIILRDEAQMNDKEVMVSDKDILISYNLHQNCIPQYNVGYEDIKTRVHEILNHQYNNNLSIGGVCFGNGIGVPDVVLNSLQAAFELKKDH